MVTLNELEPTALWKYFFTICEIPRPSKKEEKIRSYLVRFAQERKLEYKVDKAGNVLIVKKAYPGMEDRKVVVLQSHLDMVCEKNSDSSHNFETDPIIPIIEQGWVKARGTTLGADDGIGIAAQLAILDSSQVKHGPLECLFTVDEETGLSGAFSLQPGFFSGKVLLNLDSEDEGEIFIGCAGGNDTLATFRFKPKKLPFQHIAFEVSVKGLKGGHSGDDIHKGLGNSNKIITRFLWNVTRSFNARIAHIDGGNLRNAIAREAKAIFTIPAENYKPCLAYFEEFSEMVKNELRSTEPGLQMNLFQADLPETIINKKTHHRLLTSLYACPHGVVEWSRDIPGLVETSTNLASVKFTGENEILVTTSQRSSVESARSDISEQVRIIFEMGKGEVTKSTGYPGWKPDPGSRILQAAQQSYRELFGKDPLVKAIHAGLECGLFLEKYPDLDMISFGPTIKGAHSPDERIEIESAGKFWKLLIHILENTEIE